MRLPSLVVLALLVGSLFAWNVSGTWFIGDDAFISFRYADNLVRGEGLVWNSGERVEGYTNFLWVLLMAGSLAIGVPPEQSSIALGIASGGALLLALGLFSLRRSGADAGLWLLLMALAMNRSFAAWCSSGLETMFFTLLVFLAYARFVAEREQQCERWPLSALLFALAALTRPEGMLFAAVAGAALLLDVVRGRRPLAAAVRFAAPLALLVGGHLAFRLGYYHAWLPNTFYAKVSGLWLDQSVHYLALFAREYQIAWFLPLVLAAVWGDRAWAPRLFVAVVASYLLYVLYVGGDRFEFRFLVIVLPYLYWLLVEGLRRLGHAALALDRGRVVVRALGLLAGAALLATTATSSLRQVPHAQRRGNVTPASIELYAMRRSHQGRFLRGLIDRGVLPTDVVTAMGGAGAVPYYTRWTTIDRRGLNDATIARMPFDRDGLIGHQHDAPHDYLVERKVAVFDIFNSLLHHSLAPLHGKHGRSHDGHATRLRAIELEGRYLIFATYVPDQELARIFAGHELIGADQAEP